MSHTIKKSNHHITTPTALYEANYRRLVRLTSTVVYDGSIQFNSIKTGLVNQCIELVYANMSFCILEQYKYTTIISLKQNLVNEKKGFINLTGIDMQLRICHDACVVEVIAYQGKSPIQSASVYPNKHMLQIDEKRQLNIFLKELLEYTLKARTINNKQ